MMKNYDDMLSRFHLVPERNGRMDRQTDRFAISISRVKRDQCCKGDASSQWEKANLPLNRQSLNIAHVVTSTISPHMPHQQTHFDSALWGQNTIFSHFHPQSP